MTADVRSKVLHVFNTICLGCIKEIKGLHEDVRAYFKKHMKVYHKDSDQYLRAYWDEIGSRMVEDVPLDDVRDGKLIGELTLGAIIDKARDNELPMVEAYVHMLNAYAHVFFLAEDADSEDASEIFETLNRFIVALSNGEDGRAISDSVLDDKTLSLLRRIANSDARCKSGAARAATQTATEAILREPDSVDKIFGNSRLGQMAKEISTSINLADLGIDANMAASGGDLGGGDALASLLKNEKAGQMLGEVISKVGQTITSRLESGEMTQMDLVQDALGMMSQLGSLGGGGKRGVGDLIKNVSTLFGGATANADLFKTAVEATGVRQRHGQVGSMLRREQMRKRLEDRKAASAHANQ